MLQRQLLARTAHSALKTLNDDASAIDLATTVLQVLGAKCQHLVPVSTRCKPLDTLRERNSEREAGASKIEDGYFQVSSAPISI